MQQSVGFLKVSSCSFDHGSEYDDFFLVVDDGSWSDIYYCNINTGECFLWALLDTQLATAFVISYGNQHPTADFTWTPSHPYLGETILFNASTSQDSDGYLDLYEWDWDKTTGNFMNLPLPRSQRMHGRMAGNYLSPFEYGMILMGHRP